MIKNKIAFILILLMVFLACDNELDLIEQSNDIPVVYAIFDVNDTAKYVRVEKAFSDPKIAPIELAKDPSNLYFDNINVSFLKEGASNVEALQKVDGNLEGYIRKDNGAFAQSPNYLYKFKNTQVLNFKDNYELQINLGEGRIIIGKTKMVEPAVLVRPNTNGNLDFDDKINTRYNWNPGENALLHSMTLIIKYDESNGNVVSAKSLDWNLFSNVSADRFEFAGREFYQFIQANIQVQPNVTRVIKGIDVVFTSAGQSLADYIRVGQANLGITSSGEVPVFSNLSEGRGIVGSRAKISLKNIQLSRNSLDRLKTLEYTKDLNFQ